MYSAVTAAFVGLQGGKPRQNSAAAMPFAPVRFFGAVNFSPVNGSRPKRAALASSHLISMGKARKTRKFAQVKRVIGNRRRQSQLAQAPKDRRTTKDTQNDARRIPQVPSNLFFNANTSLKPPYQILLDTNFFAHSIRAKIDIETGLMDLLFAKCTPIVSDCVLAELEKLGPKYRLALRAARDERFQRLKCQHTGTYADDCIVQRVMQHRIYLVGTNDADLRRRLRKVPGVPLIAVAKGGYKVERLPEAFG